MPAVMTGTPIDAARWLAYDALTDLPERWRHTVGVAERAAELTVTVGPSERDLLVAAAWLHDIGYARELYSTGFHALDGALFLDRHRWPRRLCALVAHHSGGWFVGRAMGLDEELRRFTRELSPVSDALAYADQTVGPRGQRLPLRLRVAEAAHRHGPESPQGRVYPFRRAYLLAVAERVERRLERVLGHPAAV
jgi:hypothetical protein